jgi:hypothetical protein
LWHGCGTFNLPSFCCDVAVIYYGFFWNNGTAKKRQHRIVNAGLLTHKLLYSGVCRGVCRAVGHWRDILVSKLGGKLQFFLEVGHHLGEVGRCGEPGDRLTKNQ